MAVRLYVGNLPFKATEEQLQGLFQQAGTVQEVSIMRDRMSGQSRGFGFIEMGSAEDAEKAIALFNGHTMDSRPLVVNEARPQVQRSPRGRGAGPV
jgi:cold-inducible RNA-binding protein